MKEYFKTTETNETPVTLETGKDETNETPVILETGKDETNETTVVLETGNDAVKMFEGQKKPVENENEENRYWVKVINCDAVNIRREPDINSEPVTIQGCGSIMEYLGDAGDFKKVTTASGICGYCKSEFLSEKSGIYEV